jgi:carboxyl-terminal processing protease
VVRRAPKLIAAYALGLLSGAALTATAATGVPYERLAAFSHALSLIEARYVDERDTDTLVYDAIGGLTQGLDDHSIFLEPDRYKELLEQTSGEYFGVGIEIEHRGDKVYVGRALAGSPAEDAGIEAGDEIVAVDGVLVGKAGEDALGGIRGERSSRVVLTLMRPGESEPRQISVVRGQVRTPSVVSRRLDDIAWIHVERFQRRTAAEVGRALAAERKAGKLAGVVLDLRGNPGGYLSQAVEVADFFIAEGPIVSTVDRGPAGQKDTAHKAGTDVDTPLAVLIDGNSASAAEIVAGALQDTGRGTLLGYNSYGKGSVQQFFELSDGSALKLTTARYLTPKGRYIHGSGIEPDLPLGPRGSRVPAIELEPLLARFGAPAPGIEGDLELQTALALLREPEPTRAFLTDANAALK